MKKINQIMIEKTKGNNNINKLRRLNIFEADYNSILKYFWPHKGANKAEDIGVMGHNQHGGRPNHSTHDVVMLNEIIL